MCRQRQTHPRILSAFLVSFDNIQHVGMLLFPKHDRCHLKLASSISVLSVSDKRYPFLLVDLSGAAALWPPERKSSPMCKDPEVLPRRDCGCTLDITVIRNGITLFRLSELNTAALSLLLLPCHRKRPGEQQDRRDDGFGCVHENLSLICTLDVTSRNPSECFRESVRSFRKIALFVCGLGPFKLHDVHLFRIRLR